MLLILKGRVMKYVVLCVLSMCSLLGCASVVELPYTARQVDFENVNRGLTVWSYDDCVTFKGPDRKSVYLAAQYGLTRTNFRIEHVDYENNAIFGEHGRTPNEWNMVAGVYLQERPGEIAVKIIIRTSKTFAQQQPMRDDLTSAMSDKLDFRTVPVIEQYEPQTLVKSVYTFMYDYLYERSFQRPVVGECFES